MSDRKSSSEYWEGEWQEFDAAEAISLDESNPTNLLYILINRRLRGVFEKNNTPTGATFFEVGCGGSRWLPYFAKEFGFAVGGIDYTDNGVATAVSVCRHHNIDAEIIKGDYEQMGLLLRGKRFDVVASFGFVEHFEDTKKCISHILSVTKENGLIVTIIPNMAGLYGLAYKLLKPSVYAIHNPIDLKQLTEAHSANGLEVISAEYLLATPGIIGETREGDQGLFKFVKNTLRHISRLLWAMELKGIRLPRSKLLSPYIMCICKKNTLT